MILNVTDLVWFWGVVAGLTSIPFTFNAFQTKGIEVKETAIYIKKGVKKKFLKKKMSKTSILVQIFVFVLAILIFVVLSFLNLEEETMDKWMTYSLIGLTAIEAGIFFYERNHR
ncbi:hypothetical protein V9L05_15055 [Bernardetia sp. Wsw4-3y2]|uniref:hypothetical protein n=1 Tax=Bernardetia sp. Wsw4-3y2 TaxID=3127471 RepID=UPI0030D55609